LEENDKFNKYSKRDVREDAMGNKYIIYKIEFGMQSTTNPLHLGNNTFYNIIDNGPNFIKDFINFFRAHTEYEEQYYNNLESYITGVFVEVTERDEVEYQPIDIENVQYKNDGDDIAIYNRFTQYKINDKATNFKEMIQVEITNDYLKNNLKNNS
jgi:hypothetical protein